MGWFRSKSIAVAAAAAATATAAVLRCAQNIETIDKVQGSFWNKSGVKTAYGYMLWRSKFEYQTMFRRTYEKRIN